MIAKMIDKIVSLKETKTFEIGGQTYTDGHLTRIPPHVDRPETISVSGLDGVCDESGNRAFGLTIFPDDGSAPIVCISAEAPISAAPELLAHELAHVATPEDKDHGEAWQTAEKAIGDKYDELLNSMIPDDDPGVLVPREVGDGGLLLMPTRAHIPDPQRDDWKPATCPICGAECWETEIHRQALAAEPGLRAVCTDCGLRGAAGVGLVDTSSKKEEKDHE